MSIDQETDYGNYIERFYDSRFSKHGGFSDSAFLEHYFSRASDSALMERHSHRGIVPDIAFDDLFITHREAWKYILWDDVIAQWALMIGVSGDRSLMLRNVVSIIGYAPIIETVNDDILQGTHSISMVRSSVIFPKHL